MLRKTHPIFRSSSIMGVNAYGRSENVFLGEGLEALLGISRVIENVVFVRFSIFFLMWRNFLGRYTRGILYFSFLLLSSHIVRKVGEAQVQKTQIPK